MTHNVVIASRTEFALSPVELFERFGQGDPSLGWLFGAETDRLTPGSVARVRIPLGSFDVTDGIARITEVVPYRRITFAHESPWSGLVTCRFAPFSGGTRLSVAVNLDDSAVEWMSAWLGTGYDDRVDSNEVRVGLLVHLSGSGALFGRGAVNCAQLAVDAVNADGGVRGRRLRLVVADDATDPGAGIIAMRRLVGPAQVHAVIGCHSSATFSAAKAVAIDASIPYLFAPMTEGHSDHPLLFCLGETPIDQLGQCIPRLAAETGGKRWYLAGNDYSWPRSIAQVARGIVDEIGGTIAGESYVTVGTREFGSLVDNIARSGAEHVISSFIGQDQVRFEQQFADAGLRATTRTIAPLLDDIVCEHLGEAADGIWNVVGYFGSLSTAANQAFRRDYEAEFGGFAPPASSVAESVYDAVQLWARAAHAAGPSEPAGVIEAMKRTRIDGPRGHLRLGADGHLEQDLFLVAANGGRFGILDEIGTVHRAG